MNLTISCISNVLEQGGIDDDLMIASIPDKY